MFDPRDTALVSLYHALKPAERPLEALGTPAQLDDLSATPENALQQFNAVIDLTDRQDRYAANLAYVLGVRHLADVNDDVEAQVAELGQKILSRFAIGDAVNGELLLREAVSRLAGGDGVVLQDAVDRFQTAFDGAFSASFDISAGQWKFAGDASETVTMLTELATMSMDCHGKAGVVRVGTKDIPVTVLEYDICTQALFERCRPGVDPRNWRKYSPFFFDDLEVLRFVPTPNGWRGVIQESVGALFTGKPVVTNLRVTYLQEPKLATVTYDLAGADPALKGDDNSVLVDYGHFSVVDEGVHRRVRLLKVVHVEGRPMDHNWWCPLWAHQLAMIGWWF